MTLFNRALSKAYRQSRQAQPTAGPEASDRETREPLVRGWVSRLRQSVARQALPSENLAEPGSGSQPGVPPAAAPQTDAAQPARVAGLPGSSGTKPTSRATAGRLPSAAWSWPFITSRLLASPAGTSLGRVASHMLAQRGVSGCACVALTGPGRRTGRSSTILAIARAACESEAARLLLVDGDLVNPDLARLLGLAPGLGLFESAAGVVALESTTLTLVEGRLSLLPLARALSPQEQAVAVSGFYSRLLGDLRTRYDLVLIDAGAWPAPLVNCRGGAALLDGLITIAKSSTDAGDLAACRSVPVASIGEIETFAPSVPQSRPHFLR